jgi:transglutaminase-like putative cysteine protease
LSDKPFEGLIDKIDLIRGYYRDSLRVASVRALAEKYAADDMGSPNIVALFAGLRSIFRYVPDPVGAELIKAPWVQASEVGQRGYTMGDCDDAASLAYSILRSVGIPARLAVGWYGETDPRHIWTEVPTRDGSYIPFDLCAPRLGVTKQNATAVQTYD